MTDGTFYLRVTNTATGEIQRYAVDVDVSGPCPDTPTSIAARIDAHHGLGASMNSSRLCLVADLGYTFDFLPAVLPVPTATNLTAASPPPWRLRASTPATENHVFTFTVAGTGAVGNGDLQLDVTDENGDVVGTVNVGAGMPPGTSSSCEQWPQDRREHGQPERSGTASRCEVLRRRTPPAFWPRPG